MFSIDALKGWFFHPTLAKLTSNALHEAKEKLFFVQLQLENLQEAESKLTKRIKRLESANNKADFPKILHSINQ
jgi:hypothetical protein